jgi:large subunit ribosomal protein L35
VARPKGMPDRLKQRCFEHLTQEEREMPKLKTKSGAKKRFRLTASGKVRINHAYKKHFMRRRPQSMLRKARGTRIASAPDAKIIKRNFLPNA